LVRAITGTSSLIVGGSAALLAAAVHSWSIAGLGALTYLALVAWDLGSERPLAEPVDPLVLTDLEALGSAEVRRAGLALVKARKAVEEGLHQAPPELREHFSASQSALVELSVQGAQLLRHADTLALHLDERTEEALSAELARIEHLRLAATDEAARLELGRVAGARRGQLEVRAELGRMYQRAMAQLLGLTAALEGLPAELIRMRALDRETVSQLSNTITEEVERMNGDVRIFEQTLRSVLEATQS
jgi:hypothetical protein